MRCTLKVNAFRKDNVPDFAPWWRCYLYLFHIKHLRQTKSSVYTIKFALWKWSWFLIKLCECVNHKTSLTSLYHAKKKNVCLLLDSCVSCTSSKISEVHNCFIFTLNWLIYNESMKSLSHFENGGDATACFHQFAGK